MLDSGERPAAGEFSPSSSQFVQWLRECPGVRISPKVKLAQCGTSERSSGAFAAENFVEDEELFMIPGDVCLTFKSSHLKSCPGFARLEEELGPWLCLMLTMVYEFLRGTASPWQPYLSTLPSSFDSLMFWSEEELQELQGSAIKDRIGKKDADTAILTRLLPIALQHPEVFPHPDHLPSFDSSEGRDYFLAVAHRMGSLIMAYAFDVESGDENDEGEDGYVTDDEDRPTSKAMVPLTDLLNAAVETHNTRLYQEEGAFIVRATKAIAAGAELISEQEELPRSECLRRYGTVPDDCTQFDVIDMPRDIICQEYGIATYDDPRLAYLDDLELLDDGYTIPRVPTAAVAVDQLLPAELIAVLYVLALSPDQARLLHAKGKEPTPHIGTTEIQNFLRAVRRRKLDYATSIGEDKSLLDLLAHDPSSRRRALAVQVRLGEKEIFVQLENALQGYLDGQEATNSAVQTRKERDESSEIQSKRRKL